MRSAAKEFVRIDADETELRKDKNKFLHVYETYFPCVIGHTRWSQINDGNRKLSDVVTPTDEAFVRLCLENYADYCQKRIGKQMGRTPTTEGEDSSESDAENEKQDGRTKRKRENVTGLWTVNGKGTTKNGGWTRDGLVRFAELVHVVREDRKANKDGIEMELLKKKKEERENLLKKRKLNTGGRAVDPNIVVIPADWS